MGINEMIPKNIMNLNLVFRFSRRKKKIVITPLIMRLIPMYRVSVARVTAIEKIEKKSNPFFQETFRDKEGKLASEK